MASAWLTVVMKLLVRAELKDVSAFLDLELCHGFCFILSFLGLQDLLITRGKA